MVQVHIPGYLQLLFRINAVSVNPQYDDILISFVYQHIHGHVVNPAAVHIVFAPQLFLPEANQICAGHKHVADGPLRRLLYIGNQGLAVRKGVGDHIKLPVRVPDFLLIHHILNQSL